MAKRPTGNARLIGGQGLLLDTCVYIDQLRDRSPQLLDDLITQRQVNHSTVAIQELMHTIGVLEGCQVAALQDSVLFLQAQKLGLVVLTANVSDYDLLLQLIPAGRTLFYRQK